jgi:hypothetical protein
MPRGDAVPARIPHSLLGRHHRHAPENLGDDLGDLNQSTPRLRVPGLRSTLRTVSETHISSYDGCSECRRLLVGENNIFTMTFCTSF